MLSRLLRKVFEIFMLKKNLKGVMLDYKLKIFGYLLAFEFLFVVFFFIVNDSDDDDDDIECRFYYRGDDNVYDVGG